VRLSGRLTVKQPNTVGPPPSAPTPTPEYFSNAGMARIVSHRGVTLPGPAQFIGWDRYRSSLMDLRTAGVAHMGDFGAGNSVARLSGACIIGHSWYVARVCASGPDVNPGKGHARAGSAAIRGGLAIKGGL